MDPVKQTEVLWIDLKQMSVFPRPLPLEVILGEHLSYGREEGAHFVKEKKHKHGFTAFLPEKLGRGIHILFAESAESISMILPLPAVDEEIEEFTAMALRICSYWTSSMTLNGEAITTKQLQRQEEDLLLMNLRLLHEIAAQVISGDRIYSMRCVTNRISMGKQKASVFVSLAGTDRFRDWLHALQEKPFYIPETEIAGSQSSAGILTVPFGVPVIFPTEQRNPFPYDMLSCFTDNIPSTIDWLVRIYDPESEMSRLLTYEYFLQAVLPHTSEMYDADHVILPATMMKELFGGER